MDPGSGRPAYRYNVAECAPSETRKQHHDGRCGRICRQQGTPLPTCPDASAGVAILRESRNPMIWGAKFRWRRRHEICRVSRILCVHRYAKVLRISHYLQRSGKFGAMGPFIGSIADQGLAALQSFGRRNDRRVAQVLPCFDERFDELWSGLSSGAPDLDRSRPAVPEVAISRMPAAPVQNAGSADGG